MIQTLLHITVALGVLLTSLTLAGCSARAPYVGARETVAGYQVRDVSVTLEIEVEDGWGWLPRLDLEDDDAFNQRVAGSLEEILEQQVESSLPGTTPADILIVLDRITIASGVARTLGVGAALPSDSELGGTVQVVDASSGLVVAATRIAAETSSQDGFNLPGLRAGSFSISSAVASLISRAVKSALSDEVQTIVQRFGERLKLWLEN